MASEAYSMSLCLCPRRISCHMCVPGLMSVHHSHQFFDKCAVYDPILGMMHHFPFSGMLRALNFVEWSALLNEACAWQCRRRLADVQLGTEAETQGHATCVWQQEAPCTSQNFSRGRAKEKSSPCHFPDTGQCTALETVSRPSW